MPRRREWRPGAIVRHKIDGSIYIIQSFDLEGYPYVHTIVETTTLSVTVMYREGLEIIGQMPEGWDHETKI